MNWWERLQVIIPRLPEAAILFILGVFGIPFSIAVLRRFMRRAGFAKAVRDVSGQIIGYGLWILLLVGILYTLGMTGLATTLTGGLLLTGVAVSQALKGLLQDMVAGLALARDKDFEVGYTVDINGTKGLIYRIGLRKVRLIDRRGLTRVIPNSKVESSEWILLDRESKLKDIKRKT